MQKTLINLEKDYKKKYSEWAEVYQIEQQKCKMVRETLSYVYDSIKSDSENLISSLNN